MNASTGNIDELLFDYIKMLTHIDLIRFNKMLHIVHENKREIIGLAEDIGYIDAVISIGYFRAALPYYTTPVLRTGCDSPFAISEGFHPCIDSPVANSFSQRRGMIITGSNASGKSTFLKMTAINAILAQTIHTCAAKIITGSILPCHCGMISAAVRATISWRSRRSSASWTRRARGITRRFCALWTKCSEVRIRWSASPRRHRSWSGCHSRGSAVLRRRTT